MPSSASVVDSSSASRTLETLVDRRIELDPDEERAARDEGRTPGMSLSAASMMSRRTQYSSRIATGARLLPFDRGECRPLREAVHAVDRAAQQLRQAILQQRRARHDVADAQPAHRVALREREDADDAACPSPAQRARRWTRARAARTPRPRTLRRRRSRGRARRARSTDGLRALARQHARPSGCAAC